MDGNISREVYEETMARYEKERADAQAKLQEQPNAISNLEEYLKLTLEISQNLGNYWEKETFHRKQRLQSLVFPSGLRYNRKLDEYRTCKVNALFALTNTLSSELGKKESGKTEFNFDFSALVALDLDPSNILRDFFEIKKYCDEIKVKDRKNLDTQN